MATICEGSAAEATPQSPAATVASSLDDGKKHLLLAASGKAASGAFLTLLQLQGLLESVS